MRDVTVSKAGYKGVAIYACSSGFTPSDPPVSVCQANATWNEPRFKCLSLTCPSPPVPAFASATPDDVVTVNEGIVYTCDPDYTPLMYGSIDNRCNAEGIWENTLPVCQRDCEQDGFVRRYSNQTCYRRREQRNWQGASDRCAGNGEMLATVKDEDTQTFLSSVLNDIASQSVWIGAREGRDWKWKHKLSCPRDGASVQVDYHGSCYHFLKQDMSWEDGSYYCRTIGGYLAEIPDESTNDLLNRKALELKENLGNDFSWWIGGYDSDSDAEKSWFWIDNTRLDYQSWKPGAELSKVCVEMERSNTNHYLWNDKRCNARIRTLCQIGMAACGDPGEPLHGRRTPDDRTTFAVGATMEFECYDGYELVGPKVTNCSTDGTWDSVKPSCQGRSDT
ncbi:limulus clotting factor C-like [Diadema setosum]|uniref:limulus clotting factor C-like n=1 Tax=Diadema setosum TaxID=31175 RepID=UPI003B3A4284